MTASSWPALTFSASARREVEEHEVSAGAFDQGADRGAVSRR